MIEALGFLVAFALVISLLVETTTWWLRAEATHGSIGLFVSRTNIYLYGGRFFSLIFAAGISLLIDISVATHFLILVFVAAFSLTTVFHLTVLNNYSLNNSVIRFFKKYLRLPTTHSKIDGWSNKYFSNLSFITAGSSFVFAMGLTLPYILASLIPDYRMSISSLAQIINSFGTLLLLFYVDQILFSAIDDGTIDSKVAEYSRGRALGFAMASVVLMFAYALWPSHGR